MSGQLSKAINETETVNRRRCRGPVPPRRLRVLQVSKLFHPIFIFLFEKKTRPFSLRLSFFLFFVWRAGWLAGWLARALFLLFVRDEKALQQSE